MTAAQIATILYWIGCGLSFWSYAVRDMLRLRILAIANCALIIPYYIWSMHEVAWEPIGMAGIIAVINIVNSVALVRERRPPKLTREQEEIHELVFPRMPRRAMLKVLARAERHQGRAGEVLLKEGMHKKQLFLIFQGLVSIIVKGTEVTRLAEGRFLGEMAFVTHQATSSARALLEVDGVYFTWSFDELEKLEEEEPDVYNEFFAALSADLAKKVAESVKGASNSGPESIHPDTLRPQSVR